MDENSHAKLKIIKTKGFKTEEELIAFTGTISYNVTAEQLITMGFKNVNDSMVFELNNTMFWNEIETKNQAAHFLSQCAYESGWGKWLTEIGSQSYFSKKDYGYKYRGAGYIQLTWDYNYQALGISRILCKVRIGRS